MHKNVIDDCCKKENSGRKRSDLEVFKGTADGMVKDALKVLEETEVEWELDHNSQGLREKFYLLRHYLDHLRRLCEDKIKGKYQKG